MGAFHGKKILTVLTSCEVYFGLRLCCLRLRLLLLLVVLKDGAEGPGPAQAQRACHTCLGPLDLPGSISLAWVYKSSVGLQDKRPKGRQAPNIEHTPRKKCY